MCVFCVLIRFFFVYFSNFLTCILVCSVNYLVFTPFSRGCQWLLWILLVIRFTCRFVSSGLSTSTPLSSLYTCYVQFCAHRERSVSKTHLVLPFLLFSILLRPSLVCDYIRTVNAFIIVRLCTPRSFFYSASILGSVVRYVIDWFSCFRSGSVFFFVCFFGFLLKRVAFVTLVYCG